MTDAVRCPRCRRGFSPVAADHPLERCPYCSASLGGASKPEAMLPVAQAPRAATIRGHAENPRKSRRPFPLPLALSLGIVAIAIWLWAIGSGVAYLVGWRPFASKAEGILNAMAGVVVVQGDSAGGTGFLVGSPQVIATNFHVVEGQKSIVVRFPDGAMIESDGFIAVAPEVDLALLHLVKPSLQGKPFIIASSVPEVGEEVRAIGSPRGLEGTVTEGVVSASRMWSEIVELQHWADTDQERRFDAESRWLQTSAPLSQGNSGGPLLNEKAEVIGINSWQYSSDAGQNLNFAIGAIHLRDLVESAQGHEPRPFSELEEIKERYVKERGLGRGTADERCWFVQRRILGTWYTVSSVLAVGLWDEPADGDTRQVRRARILDNLRRAAKNTRLSIEDLKQTQVEKSKECEEYVQALIGHLEAIAEQYTVAADGYEDVVEGRPETPGSEWLKALIAPQIALNNAVTTDGAALRRRLEHKYKQSLYGPIDFSPVAIKVLFDLGQDVPPVVTSSVLTGGITPYFRSSYFEYYDDPTAVQLLRFMLKRWPEGHELHAFAREELARRDTTDSPQ